MGRAMAQAVSRRPLTAEARVRSRVSPCEIYGGQSGTGSGFSPSTSVFPCQFHSTGAPLLGKMKKKMISPCGICGGQSGTDKVFSPSTSVFPCQFHSTGAPLLGKMKKKWSVHVGFVVDKVELIKFFLQVLRFSPVNFIPLVLHYSGK
jgi:hypothetical protein